MAETPTKCSDDLIKGGWQSQWHQSLVHGLEMVSEYGPNIAPFNRSFGKKYTPNKYSTSERISHLDDHVSSALLKKKGKTAMICHDSKVDIPLIGKSWGTPPEARPLGKWIATLKAWSRSMQRCRLWPWALGTCRVSVAFPGTSSFY